MLEIREKEEEITIDEIVADDVDFFHIEQMDAKSYWFSISIKEKEWHFSFTSRASITLSCTERPE